ncbi:hypothetical protein ACTGJ9_018385 [Bradyrhizobium sp. RDM12]
MKMDREIEGFISGHRPKDSNAVHDYGDRWIATMSSEIEKYPRIDIPALRQAPKLHRVRRLHAGGAGRQLRHLRSAHVR